jgi:hypothetical protein
LVRSHPAGTVTFAAGSDIGQDVTSNLSGGDDSAVLAGQVGNGHTSIMLVDLRDGNDSVVVTATGQMVSGSTYFFLGNGDDTFSIESGATFLSARADGYARNDTFIGAASYPGMFNLNFEAF